jgi:UDP:flavonoid glycosyltransferase YjiC (YdhE family)
MVGVTGLAGHALPAVALARELRSRGHDVLFHSHERWQGTIEELGVRFAGSAAEIVALKRATEGRPPQLADVARALAASIDEYGPDVVVGDGLTLSPALAAELRGVRHATLFPEVYPYSGPGLPLFSMGLMPPRTAIGATAWRALAPLLATRLPSTRWLRQARSALNDQRARLGLPPRPGHHGPVSEGPAIVATLPQLEYPRPWPADVHVSGPLFFDPPAAAVEPPPGEDPLVLVAPSTVKDPDATLVRATLAALADQPVRVLATLSGAPGPRLDPLPPNARVVDWADYSRIMPAASLVISGGTHGTVVRALSEGIPLLVIPRMPDDAEHGARVAWAGVGLSVPARLASPGAIRAVAARVLGDRRFAARAAEIARWCESHDGARRAATVVEGYARR